MFSVPIVPSVPSVLIMPVVLIVFMLLVVQMATRYKKYRIAGDMAYANLAPFISKCKLGGDVRFLRVRKYV